jgi:glutaredoxin
MPPDPGPGRGAGKALLIEVELLHLPDCPHVERARALLDACVTELGLRVRLREVEGNYPSPTIRVNGADVMGSPTSQQPACRLDVPTRQKLVAALRRAGA